jgi:thymidine phosphorylase
VESIPLIVASILSKKLAEGIDGLVLDVKVGRGAFMKTEADGRRLAEAMVRIGAGAGLTTEAMLTAMDAPLGRAVGNALEIDECIEALSGRGPSDLVELCVALATRMLRLAGGGDEGAAEARVRGVLASGAAVEKFRQVVENQGGDPRIVDDRTRLPHVPASAPFTSPRAGFVGAMHADLIGRASMLLGAGRERLDSTIDPRAGLRLLARPGDPVDAGDPLVELHPGAGARVDDARVLLAQAVIITDAAPPPVPLIHGIVS